MTPHIKQKRDSLALEKCHPGVSLMEHEKVVVEHSMNIWKDGFDTAYVLMLEEFKPIIKALENVPCDCAASLCGTSKCVCDHISALAQFKERFGDHETLPRKL